MALAAPLTIQQYTLFEITIICIDEKEMSNVGNIIYDENTPLPVHSKHVIAQPIPLALPSYFPLCLYQLAPFTNHRILRITLQQLRRLIMSCVQPKLFICIPSYFTPLNLLPT